MHKKGAAVPYRSATACVLCCATGENLSEAHDWPIKSGERAPSPRETEQRVQIGPTVVGMFLASMEWIQYDVRGASFSVTQLH